jgi:adenosylcobyric acid synthase
VSSFDSHNPPSTRQNRGLMIQGTSSDAGKSTVVAALCRVYARRGISVAPFKPQNMALNSAVTGDGGEIGRAQAVQAQAAGIEPSVLMNPILLKPSSDTGAQIIILGKALHQLEAKDYHAYKPKAAAAVFSAYQQLCSDFTRVVIEGAGSPAEVNLREGDIANMGFAEVADVPVVLVADIDRGGVFAQIIGTLELLSDSERARVKGFIINKFRGDIALLQNGLDWLEARTGLPVIGVLPFLHGLDLAAEDAVNQHQPVLQDARIRVVVPVWPRMSNHDDFDPLRAHPQIDLQFAYAPGPLPAADLIILPGSKNVRADLAFMRDQGWDKQLQKHLRYGGKVLGICGGYQMLGRVIRDPLKIESSANDCSDESTGLGYLPLETWLSEEKILRNVKGQCLLAPGDKTALKQTISARGYEIHAGRSTLQEPLAALFRNEEGEDDGAISTDNLVAGTYWHGLFQTPGVITAVANWVGTTVDSTPSSEALFEKAINHLADSVEEHLRLDLLEPLFSNGNHSND